MKYKIPVLAALVFLTTSVSAAEVKVTTQQEWNQGTFTGTSADRNDNSGNLGLGYKNGTSSDSLVGYWRLDRSISGSGGTVKDYSGNGNDGTTRNGIGTGQAGIFSTNSLSLTDNTHYVEVPHSSELNPDDELTISAWIKLNSLNKWQRIVNKYDHSSSTERTYELLITDNNYLELRTGDGSNSFNIYGNTKVEAGKWYHVAGKIKSGTGYVYLNGEQDGTGNAPDQITQNTVDLGFGAYNGEYTKFDGKIDEIRIYNRGLSDSEIKELYFKGTPFESNYSREITSSNSKTWNEIEVDTSSIPTDTSVDAVFRAKDSSDNVIDSQVIDLQEGQMNYSLEVADSEKAEIIFNGSSSDATKSWRIDGFKVYAGFCDYRGPKNECVMNSTRQLESKTYDISSIFKSRSTAVFEAFSGTSTLNISNSSRISGTWRGSFDIQSTPVTIEPGVSFKPENGRIIVGN